MSSLVKQPDTISPFAIAGEALAINARTTPRLKTFLKLYPEKAGNVSEAARVAGIERKTHYRALQQDPHYREAFAWVQRQVGEDLEASAIQQAKDGNAQLMGMLLKRFLPEEYARVSNGIEININLSEKMALNDARLDEMYHDVSNECVA